jgi:hypothetical protein
MMKEEAWFDGSAGGDVAIDIDGNSGLHERGSGARGARGASSSSTTSSAQPNAFEGLQDKIVYEVAGRMFQQAQTQAGGYMNLYANLELIKPYFDVELSTVLRRIKLSFVPRQSSELLTSGAPDLYGPTMLVFTLVAILLLGMKLSHKTVEEGTLMGSAFGLCFSYATPLPDSHLLPLGPPSPMSFINFIFYLFICPPPHHLDLHVGTG